MGLKKYHKKLKYSYSYGIFPTLDLFKYKKDKIIKVVLDTKGQNSKGQQNIRALAKKNNIKVEFNTKAIKQISAKENTYAIALFEKYRGELKEGQNHLVLVNPSNTGNLGTIIRTMLGFGIKNIAIIRPAVDVFDPKVVRSSMGSVFATNFEYFDTFKNYADKYNNHLYTFLLKGKGNLREISFRSPFALVFGNESSGLDDSYLDVGQSVYIPHSKDIDSLNLSIAASLALWESSK